MSQIPLPPSSRYWAMHLRSHEQVQLASARCGCSHRSLRKLAKWPEEAQPIDHPAAPALRHLITDLGAGCLLCVFLLILSYIWLWLPSFRQGHICPMAAPTEEWESQEKAQILKVYSCGRAWLQKWSESGRDHCQHRAQRPYWHRDMQSGLEAWCNPRREVSTPGRKNLRNNEGEPCNTKKDAHSE